jgi:nucleoside-diphosphate-sugar epimerase
MQEDSLSANINHVVVTGGAGFIGSHVCRALIDRGDRVTAIDNLCTGFRSNLDPIIDNVAFELRIADVVAPVAFAGLAGVTHVAHLACPASPRANTAMPIDTLKAATVGTLNALECGHKVDARVVVVSSSEIYGDPLVHPQTEDYRGNADPVGAHSAYTEGKRAGEAATAAYRRIGANVGIVRPFNVYGPNLQPSDGRVVAAFCAAALRRETLRLHGGGTQTRALTYIADFVAGLIAMLDSDEFGPVNLGSEEETTIADLARLVIEQAGTGELEITQDRDSDLVTMRRPDTTRARTLLDWQASTSLRDGLVPTMHWMRQAMRP